MSEIKSTTGISHPHRKSMSCEEFTVLASKAMEERIGFQNRMGMFWHKVKCVYCRRFLSQLKKIHELLSQDVQQRRMPPHMLSTIQKNLENRA